MRKQSRLFQFQAGLILLLIIIGIGQMQAATAHPYQIKGMEEYKQEQAQWREIIKRDPKNPEPYLQLGASLSAEASEGYWCATAEIAVYREAIAVVPLNSNPNTTWILLQKQGQRGDRQMQFTQLESLLPIVDEATFSQLMREPQKIDRKTLQTLAQGKTWRLRWITINESVQQPGYVDAHLEVNCGTQQLRIAEKTAVSYENIQSPGDEILKAVYRQMTIVQRRLAKRPIAARASSQGEAWRPLTSTSPIYQFVCQQPGWRQSILENQLIPQAELAQSRFSTIEVGGALPPHLFAHAWQNVWRDGTFPKPLELAKLNPPLPAYLEILRTTKGWEGKFVGLYPKPSKIFQAFEQAMKAGEKIRPEIEQILQSGTPAGKMYAVTVLASFDPDRAKQVLETLKNDHSVVPEKSGDLVNLRQVSDWAVATLKGLAMAPSHGAFPTHLATLRETTRLEGRALGVAGVPSKTYQAFEQAMQPKTSRSQIDRLLHESTPAGRIYATMLLVKLDPKAGRQLLGQMRSDQTALIEASGCEISRTSVGEAVEDILQGRSSVFPPLP